LPADEPRFSVTWPWKTWRSPVGTAGEPWSSNTTPVRSHRAPVARRARTTCGARTTRRASAGFANEIIPQRWSLQIRTVRRNSKRLLEIAPPPGLVGKYFFPKTGHVIRAGPAAGCYNELRSQRRWQGDMRRLQDSG